MINRVTTAALLNPDGVIICIRRTTNPGGYPGDAPDLMVALSQHIDTAALRFGKTREEVVEAVSALRWETVTDVVEAHALSASPWKFRVEEGRLKQLPEVRLSVSQETFIIGGDDAAEIMVIEVGDALPKKFWPIRIKINDTAVVLGKGEVYSLTSKVEGLWVVGLDDPRVWAEQERRMIRALPSIE